MERQQALEVMLVEGHGHADEHGDAAHAGHQVLHLGLADVLVEHVHETNHAVHAALGQDAGNHHGDGSRRNRVRVRCQRLEREHERLGAEAHKQEAERRDHHGVHMARRQLRNLRQVQRMQVGVDEDGAHQDARRAQRADNQILERALERTVGIVAEGGERHGGEGHDFHHDEDVEQVAGEHEAQHGAAQHEEQRVEIDLTVVFTHIREGVRAGHHDRNGHDEAKEQGQRVDLQADAVGPAGLRRPAAQPVGDDAALKEDRLHQQRHEREGNRHGNKDDDVARLGALTTDKAVDECAHEQRHDRQNREVFH